MKKINLYLKNIVINLIYYLSIFIISYFYINTFSVLHIQDKVAFCYSYFLGIFAIFIISFIFITLTQNNYSNTTQTLNKNKFKHLFLLLLITITLYIIYIIYFSKSLFTLLNFSNGLINTIQYYEKILLFSGVLIPINLLFNFNKKIEKNIYILIIKITIYALLALIFLNIFKVKGLLYTISILEFLYFIFNIFVEKKNTY